jgi:hypothetical protein
MMDVSAGFRTTIKGSDVWAPKFGDALGTKIPIIIGGGSKLEPKWGVRTQQPIITGVFSGGLQGEGTGIIQLPKVGQGVGLKYGDRYASAGIQTQTPVQIFKEVEATKQVSITQQKFTFKGLTPNATPPIIPPTGFGFGWGFIPPLGMDIRQPRSRRVKAKKILRYTPSFGALIFGIRGKKPKGIETGLRVRPIPRGQFNFVSPAGSRGSPLTKILKRFR